MNRSSARGHRHPGCPPRPPASQGRSGPRSLHTAARLLIRPENQVGVDAPWTRSEQGPGEGRKARSREAPGACVAHACARPRAGGARDPHARLPSGSSSEGTSSPPSRVALPGPRPLGQLLLASLLPWATLPGLLSGKASSVLGEADQARHPEQPPRLPPHVLLQGSGSGPQWLHPGGPGEGGTETSVISPPGSCRQPAMLTRCSCQAPRDGPGPRTWPSAWGRGCTPPMMRPRMRSMRLITHPRALCVHNHGHPYVRTHSRAHV